MKKQVSASCFVLIFLFVVTIVCGDDKNQNKSIKVYWKDGVHLDSEDKNVQLTLGGRLLNDWMWNSTDSSLEDAFGETASGNEWRAAWGCISGKIYKNIELKMQFDFAGGDVDAKDLYIGYSGLTLGSLRVGHQKEPFGLDSLTANKYTTFIERSLANVFFPGRNTGVALRGAINEERITYGVGLFTDADNYGNAKAHDDTYALSGKMTCLPWLEENSRLAHLGASFQYRSMPENGAVRFRQRPEAHLMPNLIDSSLIAADSNTVFGLEGAIIFDRYSLQGEWIQSRIDSPEIGDISLKGFYLFGSIFLTDDHRGYSKGKGSFTRVRPESVFSPEGGTGAVELAIRYSSLDFEDFLPDEKLDDITFGVNWYLNDYTRIMCNYIYAKRKSLGNTQVFMTRFMVAF